MILEEKRQLNEYKARRALSFVMVGKPVPILNDLPWGVPETVSLDDACPKLSSVPPVSANDILGTRDPESLARAHALSMESSRKAWKPPSDRNKTMKSHSTHVPIPSGVIHGAARSSEVSNQPEYGKLCSALEIPSGVLVQSTP